MIPNGNMICLCRPDKKPVSLLNGVQIETVSYTEYIKDYHRLTFTVSRYLEYTDLFTESLKQEFEESNSYELLHVGMLIYLEDTGYFKIQEPTINFDGYTETKEISCYAVYKELEDKDLVGFSVNTGLDGSLERYEENLDIAGLPKEYVSFYQEKNHRLSLMHLVLEKLPGWSLGYIDPIIGYDEETKKISRFSFDVDSENVYSFLTSTVASTLKCIFIFDHLNYVIHAHSTLNFGEYTNVFLGQRNLIETLVQSSPEDSVYTRFHVSGADDLNIRNWNYNDPRILNLDYFLTDEYLSQEMVSHIKAWTEYRETHREEFAELSRQLTALENQITEIELRVPNDGDNWRQWDGMELKLLEKNLDYYKALLVSLQISVDPNPQYTETNGEKTYLPWVNAQGEIDHEKYLSELHKLENGSGGYYTYLEIKDYIIPNIELAIDNYEKPSDVKEDYIKDYETNWVLYGTKELKGLIQKYEENLKTYKNYKKPWNELNPDEKTESLGEASYNQKHQEYLDILSRIGNARTPDTIKYQLAQLLKEIDELEKQKQPILNDRQILIDAASDLNEKWFHTDERAILYSLFRDTDYVNENITTTSIDTALSTIDVEETLYEDAVKKLSEVSQPQFKIRITSDNLLALEEFRDWSTDFIIGNYIWVGVRDDYAVKLRLVSRSWNPCTVTPELDLEFSNMITSASGRNDLTYLLGEKNGSGKNRISGGIGSSKDVEEYMTQMLELMKNSQLFSGIVGSAVNSSIIGNGTFGVLVGDYIKAAEINVDKITGKDAYFETFASKYINTDFLKANVSVVELLKAADILAENIHGGSGAFTGILKGVKIIGADIEADTITANKIIIRGSDTSLVYQLNNGVLTTEEMGNEALKNQLHGKNIVADSITAAQIDVGNLWAATVEALEIHTKGLSAITAKIGNWTLEANQIIGTGDSFIKGGVLESALFSADDNGNVTNGCRIDLNHGIISTKSLTIHAKNFTLDSEGNATYTGTIDAGQLRVGLNANLVRNGLDTFEQYTKVPQHGVGSSSTGVGLDYDHCYYGTRSLRLEEYNSSSGTFVNIGKDRQDAIILLEGGKTYIMSCYVYHNYSSSVPVSLTRISHPINNISSESYTKYDFYPAGNKWTRIYKAFTIPSSITNEYFSFRIGIGQPGKTVYFDAFQLELVYSEDQEPGAFKPAAVTQINGSNITAGTIQDSDGNFVLDLTAGTVTAKKLSITSNNFTLDGKGNATYTGKIDASQLNIGLNSNLMPNGLDTLNQYTEVPYWYSNVPYGFNKYIDTTMQYSGATSIKLSQSLSSDSEKYIYLGSTKQKSIVQVEVGKTYVLSCYACTTYNGDVSVTMRAALHNSTLTSYISRSTSHTISGNGKWQRISFTYTAESNYPYLSFGIGLYTVYAIVWFCAFQIEEVSNTAQEPGAFKPAGTTIINGDNITAGIIKSKNGIFKLDLDNEVMTANNLIVNSQFFQLTENGMLTCINGIFNGSVEATSLNVKNQINMTYLNYGVKESVQVLRIENKNGEEGDGELIIQNQNSIHIECGENESISLLGNISFYGKKFSYGTLLYLTGLEVVSGANYYIDSQYNIADFDYLEIFFSFYGVQQSVKVMADRPYYRINAYFTGTTYVRIASAALQPKGKYLICKEYYQKQINNGGTITEATTSFTLDRIIGY